MQPSSLAEPYVRYKEQIGGVVTRSRSDFAQYAEARRTDLRRLAYSLCGDWHQADDIVQIALTKLYVAWPRVRRGGTEDAYARRIIARVAIDESRRPWRRETPSELPSDQSRSTSPRESTHDVISALQQLPPRQRQVVVLRHWVDMSVDETATALGLSTGTVKSQTSRALAKLHQILTSTQSMEGGSYHVGPEARS